MTKSLVEMAAGIIQSQCGTNNMTSEEIAASLQSTFKALVALQAEEVRGSADAATAIAGSEAKPAVNITPARSIQKNKIICLECGQEFKMLSPKHLKSHGLTGREYRIKHGLSIRQPLCAKSLSERRKKAGKERGLPENLKKVIAQRGKKRKPARKKK